MKRIILILLISWQGKALSFLDSLHKHYTIHKYIELKGHNMKQTFEVINVKCGGCASTLKTSLAEEFGEVEVNLLVLLGRWVVNIHKNMI